MSGAIVECADGALRGAAHDSIRIFRGIPFAQPPVGDLRFSAPRPPLPWSGVRDAQSFAQPSAQVPPTLGDALAGSDPSAIVGAEDCLYLNVYAPADPGPHPVLVWIHGGGAVSGSANECDGTRLAQQGVVVVTVAYRLGALGLLHLPGVFAEEQAHCNFALLDQIAALAWVRRSIAAFGGDPGRVTVAGASNGGRTVGGLLASPPAQGLFHQAVSISGTGVGYLVAEPEHAERLTTALLAELGLDRSSARRLRELPAQDIIAAQVVVLARSRTLLPFQVVVDEETMPGRPIDAIAAGAACQIPIMVGSTHDEYDYFQMVGAVSGRSVLVEPEPLEWAIAAYREMLSGWSEQDVRRHAVTSADWWIPAIRLAEASVQAGGRAWVYRMDWRLAPRGQGYGAPHGLEGPLIVPADPQYDGVMLAAARRDTHALEAVIEAMRTALVRFVHSGQPGRAEDWPAYDLNARPTFLFDDRSEAVADPERELRTVWDEML
jgi:para-nitrobenzyl esterase